MQPTRRTTVLRTLLLCACFAVVTSRLQAATIVGGFINTNTTWTAAGNPYIAENSLLIDQAKRLKAVEKENGHWPG